MHVPTIHMVYCMCRPDGTLSRSQFTHLGCRVRLIIPVWEKARQRPKPKQIKTHITNGQIYIRGNATAKCPTNTNKLILSLERVCREWVGWAQGKFHCLPTRRALVILLGVPDKLVELRTIMRSIKSWQACMLLMQSMKIIFHC